MEHDEIRFGDLIASSIHDMKNSLNLQISALEAIARQCRDRQDQDGFEGLGRVIAQASRMNLNLVELLGLYKLGKAIYPVDIAEHAVAEVMEDAVMQHQALLEFKGITVTLDCEPDCYWYMDYELVKGVLLNGLHNAFDHTRDQILLTARVHPHGLELRVEDNGPGYPESMLQAPGPDTPQGVNFQTGSTGLGFYFSQQVAQLHRKSQARGSVAIENGGHLGGGCFVLSLP